MCTWMAAPMRVSLEAQLVSNFFTSSNPESFETAKPLSLEGNNSPQKPNDWFHAHIDALVGFHALRWVQDEKSGKGVECWADGARCGSRSMVSHVTDPAVQIKDVYSKFHSKLGKMKPT